MPASTSERTAVSGGEFRPTLRLALPLIIAEVGWMSMGVVDTIMVGRLPNSAVAIGATGLGQSLYAVVAIFGGGLLLGMIHLLPTLTVARTCQTQEIHCGTGWSWPPCLLRP